MQKTGPSTDTHKVLWIATTLEACRQPSNCIAGRIYRCGIRGDDRRRVFLPSFLRSFYLRISWSIYQVSSRSIIGPSAAPPPPLFFNGSRAFRQLFTSDGQHKSISLHCPSAEVPLCIGQSIESADLYSPNRFSQCCQSRFVRLSSKAVITRHI